MVLPLAQQHILHAAQMAPPVCVLVGGAAATIGSKWMLRDAKVSNAQNT